MPTMETTIYISHDKVSTGIDSTPTPLGTFSVWQKHQAGICKGPLPGVSDVPFDLPWCAVNLYFTLDGAVIHGVILAR